MTATLVTALYDIDREDEEKGDGRKWEEYINWFANTLRIPSPMVVYVDPSSKKFVEELMKNVKANNLSMYGAVKMISNYIIKK